MGSPNAFLFLTYELIPIYATMPRLVKAMNPPKTANKMGATKSESVVTTLSEEEQIHLLKYSFLILLCKSEGNGTKVEEIITFSASEEYKNIKYR